MNDMLIQQASKKKAKNKSTLWLLGLVKKLLFFTLVHFVNFFSFVFPLSQKMLKKVSLLAVNSVLNLYFLNSPYSFSAINLYL